MARVKRQFSPTVIVGGQGDDITVSFDPVLSVQASCVRFEPSSKGDIDWQFIFDKSEIVFGYDRHRTKITIRTLSGDIVNVIPYSNNSFNALMPEKLLQLDLCEEVAFKPEVVLTLYESCIPRIIAQGHVFQIAEPLALLMYIASGVAFAYSPKGRPPTIVVETSFLRANGVRATGETNIAAIGSYTVLFQQSQTSLGLI